MVTTGNGRLGVKSTCQQCGSGKFTFASKRGGDIQAWITEKFPGTELHLPVVTDHGIEKASFAGPGTDLDKRIKNLDANALRAYKGEEVPESDVITRPKSSMDAAAMYHDLRYHHAGKVAKSKKELMKMKRQADRQLMVANVKNAVNPFTGTTDRLTNAVSAPAFAGKIAYESLWG